jgi:hypothetical protein
VLASVVGLFILDPVIYWFFGVDGKRWRWTNSEEKPLSSQFGGVWWKNDNKWLGER